MAHSLPTAETREIDGLEVEENDDAVDGVIGDADGCANEVMSITQSNRVHSPIKSCWLFPLIVLSP